MRLLARSLWVFALVVLAACKPDVPPPVDAGVDAGVTDAGSLEKTLTVHYHRALADYAGWAIAVTEGAKETSVTSTSSDGFGGVYGLTLKDGATSLKFSIANGASSDPAGALTVDLSGGKTEAWVISGLAKAITHTPLALPGPKQVALYYQRPDAAYSGFGLHLWGEFVTETTWGGALQPVGTDPDLGSAFVIPIVSGNRGNCPAGTICLIMHNGDTKDPGPDMQWARATLGDLVFLSSGSSVLTPTPRKEGAVDLTGAAAHLLSRNVLAWDFNAAAATTFELRWSATADIKLTETGVTGGQVIALTPNAGGLSAALKAKAPHLKTWRAFDVAADVSSAVKGQLVAIARKADGAILAATRVQTAFALDDLFATTEPLGPSFATVAGIPTARVWAPTAQSVKLHVYDAAKAEVAGSPVTMTANAKGVWSATGPASWYGQFYRFELTVFHPVTDKVETVTTTDPYSTSLSMNSKYSQFIDLTDPALAPAGWSTLAKPAFAGPQDTVLYEGHVRDFSVTDATVPMAHRGRYLAFSDQNADGMKHLSALAQAGLTHLHLLPVFDIATIEEDASKRIDLTNTVNELCANVTPAVLATITTVCTQHGTKTIAEAMAALPGDGELQQAVATAMRKLDGFNWGYDPLHYGVPEGSYASTAEGTARIIEFRQMVAALAQSGLRVVMDVVYNHTNASGLTDTSVLDKVVPGYYHRLDEKTGTVASSTCCANTATEHQMMQRLMVDTLVRWARDFKVDGFRFDLMGHHMKANILDAKAALAALTVTADGVDGTKIILYGEGWEFGEVAGDARGVTAVQRNMGGTGVGTFNDRIRDGIRGGSAFDSKADIRKKQGFATGLFLDPNELSGTSSAERDTLDKLNTFVRFGMAGNLESFKAYSADGYAVFGRDYGYNGSQTGYTSIPWESINYCSAHDNQTFWDIAQYKLPTGTTPIERARLQVVALAPLLLGEGIPFIHMGDDVLRSKSMERDSYDSGDWFNRIDWTASSNGWKSGLPNAEKDDANWPLIKAIFADATTTPSAAAIALSRDRFRELLRERKSSPLLRLANAGEVNKRVDFPNGGASQVRGLIVMTVSDGTCAGSDLDPLRDGLVVLINAGKTAASWTMSGATGLTLHPVDQGSADMLARTSTFAGGTFTVPGHSVAVFEQRQTGAQGAGLPCNTR